MAKQVCSGGRRRVSPRALALILSSVEPLALVTPERQRLAAEIANVWFAEPLFDRIPDTVFFVKDRSARYVVVNQTLVERCGLRHKKEILGRTAEEVFPAPLGKWYTAQDRHVLTTGLAIRDRLELHLYPGGRDGWCLTYKFPLLNREGTIVGLAGVSRDIHRPDERRPDYRLLAQAVTYMDEHYGDPIRVEDLARMAGMSVDRFERLVMRVFHLTPRQLLAKVRLEAALRLLRTTAMSICEVAYACGYSDHSAFTRQFKVALGMTPVQYRRLVGALVTAP